MRDDALKHRSHRFLFPAAKAQEIEKMQKLAYEKKTQKPALPKPEKPAVDGEGDKGYSDPEWEPQRSCWLVYRRSNSSEWKAWEAIKEKWVNLDEWDECMCSPSSSSSSQSTS
jgi:hypothetical protein